MNKWLNKLNLQSRLIFLRQLLEQEQGRVFLWLPVFYGIGIISYFSLKFEPSWWFAAATMLPGLLFIILQRGKIFFLLLLVSAGFIGAKITSEINFGKQLQVATEPVYLHGIIADLQQMNSGFRAVITDVDLWQTAPENTPGTVRINIKTDINGAEPGDKIALKVKLSPPSPPVFPNEYDFARYAYFNNIDAVGFSLSDIEILEKSADNKSFINRLRNDIAARIMTLESSGSSKAALAIAVAMLVGEEGAIPKEVIEQMRGSGLSHILSISGLHMAIVMSLSFYFIRALLALLPYIALRFDIKKIAACASLILGFLYLLLAGAPVSAVRSYIMAAMFFVAILLNRTGSYMRPVALAALIIIIFEPHALMSPSFQMSFAAVIGLIAAYESKSFRKISDEYREGFIRRILFALASVAFSSLVAGFATFFFVAYHFGSIQIYGLLGNMLAIPITSFVVMPAGIMALLAMPFGLESFFVEMAAVAINFIIKIAVVVSSIDYANILVKQLPAWSLLLFISGGIAISFMYSKLRYGGIILIFVSFLGFFAFKTPDVIINDKGDLYALNQDGELYFSSLVKSRYARKTWAKINGQKQQKKISAITPEISVEQKNDGFLISKNQQNIFITRAQLEARGAHTLWISNKIIVRTVADEIGNRPWQKYSSSSSAGNNTAD